MNPLKIIYWRTKRGDKPVEKFILSLPRKHQIKILAQLKLFEEWGRHLPPPYSEKIRGDVWELRIRFASDIYRIFYFIHRKREAILLHSVHKKTQKIPLKDIELAEQRMKNYKIGRKE